MSRLESRRLSIESDAGRSGPGWRVAGMTRVTSGTREPQPKRVAAVRLESGIDVR